VADQDPAEAYRVDLLTGERDAGPDRELALAYVRAATEISRMAGDTFFARYGEVSRVVAYFAEPAGEVAERILDLHSRHSGGVCGVVDRAIAEHASAWREGSLPPSALRSTPMSLLNWHVALMLVISNIAIWRHRAKSRRLLPAVRSTRCRNGASRLDGQSVLKR
jgi:hypothetical protein